MSESDEPLTYAGSGVSLEAGEKVVERIRTAVTSTHGRQVLGGHGGFAGLYTPSVGDPLVAAARLAHGAMQSDPTAVSEEAITMVGTVLRDYDRALQRLNAESPDESASGLPSKSTTE